MEETILVTKAMDLNFGKANAAPKEQPCNLCGKLLRSILASPRKAVVWQNGKPAFAIYSCSDRCSKTMKKSAATDLFIKKYLDEVVKS